MKVNFLGYRELDFKTRDGDKIEGMQLYIAWKTPDVNGLMSDAVMIRPDVYADIVQLDIAQFVGEEIDIEFDRKGKPVCISACGVPAAAKQENGAYEKEAKQSGAAK